MATYYAAMRITRGDHEIPGGVSGTFAPGDRTVGLGPSFEDVEFTDDSGMDIPMTDKETDAAIVLLLNERENVAYEAHGSRFGRGTR